MESHLEKQDRQCKINIWNLQSDELWLSTTIVSFAVGYHKVSFVSNVIWLTVVLCTRLKPNGKFCMGLKGIDALNASVFTEVASQLSCNLYLFCTQLCTIFW